MVAQAHKSDNVAPRWSALLSAAYLAHLCEEWWGGPGFSVWAQSTLGLEITPARFLFINAIAWPLFTVGIIGAIRSRRFAWFAATFAALLVLNGLLHLLATAVFSAYSPGTVTGVLLYLPLGGLVGLSMFRLLPSQVFAGAVFAGVAIHALVATAAFV